MQGPSFLGCEMHWDLHESDQQQFWHDTGSYTVKNGCPTISELLQHHRHGLQHHGIERYDVRPYLILLY